MFDHRTGQWRARGLDDQGLDREIIRYRLRFELGGVSSTGPSKGTKGRRKVIFEAKTVTAETELAQTRSGLSQLLEYRFFYGEPKDVLCLVTDAPISDRSPCGTLAPKFLA